MLKPWLTGKENKDEIARFQNAACEFIKGHNVIEIEKIGQEIYEEYVSPAIWQGTVEIAQEHLSKGEEVWMENHGQNLLVVGSFLMR